MAKGLYGLYLTLSIGINWFSNRKEKSRICVNLVMTFLWDMEDFYEKITRWYGSYIDPVSLDKHKESAHLTKIPYPDLTSSLILSYSLFVVNIKKLDDTHIGKYVVRNCWIHQREKSKSNTNYNSLAPRNQFFRIILSFWQNTTQQGYKQ